CASMRRGVVGNFRGLDSW
nr:immunoglobulin heavy chain junction region [Macaca mulatta]MOX94082.1 immunoglobulin heavy chain junction region [Macaca mulatta]MOX96970.1 immunoglobulin heavy chain junction region [Macaca mulatta]